jgi:hypothetical protein
MMEELRLKMSKTIPDRKKILRAMSPNISRLKGNRHESNGNSNAPHYSKAWQTL